MIQEDIIEDVFIQYIIENVFTNDKLNLFFKKPEIINVNH